MGGLAIDHVTCKWWFQPAAAWAYDVALAIASGTKHSLELAI